MKNIYVLSGGCIGDRYVIGVFSSKKRANEERERIIKTDSYYRNNPDDLEVEVFELNKVDN